MTSDSSNSCEADQRRHNHDDQYPSQAGLHHHHHHHIDPNPIDAPGSAEQIMRQIRVLLNATTNQSALQAIVSLMTDSRNLNSYQDQLNQCKATLVMKSRELDQALDTISILESRVARGEMNPSKTKVLRLKKNPSEPGCRNEDKSTQTDTDQQYVQLTLEIKQLTDQLQTWKKRRDTLKTVFSKQTEQFRDDCLQLLGFKIEYLAESHEYRLRSVFCSSDIDDDDASFLFRRKRDGCMQVIETGLIKRLPSSVIEYLHSSASIPVFLSQANLYLWRLTIEHQ